jgi:hypothetical protein
MSLMRIEMQEPTMSREDTDLLNSKPTAEKLAAMFKAALAELRMTPADLAAHMHKNRDYRDLSATIRSIQRMVSGNTRVSGEMLVIVSMLLRQRRRLRAKYPDLPWHRNEHGVYSTQVEDWYVHIAPQTNGRWLLWCRNGSDLKDHSPPFGPWWNSLEDAKEKALACVEEGMNDVAVSPYQDL